MCVAPHRCGHRCGHRRRCSGRELVADVAMGETPTHGKIEVQLSPPRPRSRPASIHLGEDDIPMLRNTKKRAASTGKLGAISLGNIGNPDNPDNPDNRSDMNNHNHTPDSSDGDGGASEEASATSRTRSKAVEWYGTIRLLVFVRKGNYAWKRSASGD